MECGFLRKTRQVLSASRPQQTQTVILDLLYLLVSLLLYGKFAAFQIWRGIPLAWRDHSTSTLSIGFLLLPVTTSGVVLQSSASLLLFRAGALARDALNLGTRIST